jgi:predicted metal-dependent peptidase
MAIRLSNLEKAKARLGLNHIFFGTIIMNTVIEVDNSLPTAATDMKKIYYNEEFFDSLDIDRVQTVLAHEALHIMLKHGLRRGSRIPKVWNFACDYSINPILVEAGFKAIESWLYDPKWKDKAPEVIYEELMKDAKVQQMVAQGEGTDPQSGGGVGGDLMEPDVGDAMDRAKAEAAIDRVTAQAANMARMAGKLPGSLERLVKSLLEPAVPWADILRDYALRVVQDDESWSRRNRRIGHVVLPARHSTRMGKLVLIGDTSGSITAAEHQRTATEVFSIADIMQPECIHILWADARVQREEVFEVGEPVKINPKGGGGTDMRVPLYRAEELEPVVTILFTDGETPWPSAPPMYPLIVLCTTKAKVPDYAEVIRI